MLSFRFIICNFKKSQIKKIYFLWSALFSVVLIDLLIEYFTGKNILGLISAMPGQRLASFTGGYTVGSSESVIGYFFYGFILVFLTIFQNLIKNQSINIFVAYSLIAVSFLIGERANFIRVFLIVNIYIFLIYEINYRTKILYFLILLISIVGFVNFNPKYKIRYYNQIKNIIINDGTLSQKSTTQYGAHYNVAKEIFKNNLLFGVGIKNFRVESASNSLRIFIRNRIGGVFKFFNIYLCFSFFIYQEILE